MEASPNSRNLLLRNCNLFICWDKFWFKERGKGKFKLVTSVIWSVVPSWLCYSLGCNLFNSKYKIIGYEFSWLLGKLLDMNFTDYCHAFILQNALRQQRFVREVTIQYNLCNEPWYTLSLSLSLSLFEHDTKLILWDAFISSWKYLF